MQSPNALQPHMSSSCTVHASTPAPAPADFGVRIARVRIGREFGSGTSSDRVRVRIGIYTALLSAPQVGGVEKHRGWYGDHTFACIASRQGATGIGVHCSLGIPTLLVGRFRARDLDSRTKNRLEITFALQRRRAARHPAHHNLSCVSRHAYDETTQMQPAAGAAYAEIARRRRRSRCGRCGRH